MRCAPTSALTILTLLSLTACPGGKGGPDTASADSWGGEGEGEGESDDDGYAGGDQGYYDTGASEDSAPPDDSADSGDTAEPEECDDTSTVTLYVSPDDSNSMASPVLTRAAVLFDYARPVYPVRTYEFMNYYSFDYAAADKGELALYAALVEGDEPGRYQLQYAIRSEDRAERAPMNLTFSIDTSGSMTGEPLKLVKATLEAIAAQLIEGDVISIVEWSDSTSIPLESLEVSGPDDPELLTAIDDLETGGSTDLSAGLSTAYGLATANWRADRINRVVLMSDGGANTGVTDIDLIAEAAGDEESDGIYMVGVGVGAVNAYNDELMDEVTDAGKGAAVYINGEPEIERIFTDRFINTFDVAARNVSVQLDLPPGFEIERFSGEEVSEDRAEIEPQHLAPNDAMVFYQTINTCAPEVLTENSEITLTVTWLDATSFEEQSTSRTWTFAELLAEDTALLEKGAAVYLYGEAMRAVRSGDDATDALEAADAAITAAQASSPSDEELTEIREVLDIVL